MKKLLIAWIAAGYLLCNYVAANAASVSFTVATAVMTNAPGIAGGPLKVQSVILTSAANNAATIWVVDAPTNSLTFTNSAYTNILSYVTNAVTLYTNFYGATNSFTNRALVDITNNVAGTTNNYNIELIGSAPTNQTVTFNNLNLVLQYGLWITNTSSGTATVTVQYTQ